MAGSAIIMAVAMIFLASMMRQSITAIRDPHRAPATDRWQGHAPDRVPGNSNRSDRTELPSTQHHGRNAGHGNARFAPGIPEAGTTVTAFPRILAGC
jgi:hypothetical protein